MDGFAVAGGSVPGTDHTKPGEPVWRNNQDAYAFRSTPGFVAGVVCDGCGSGSNNEFGAQLGSRVVLDTLETIVSLGVNLADSEVVQRVLALLTTNLVGALSKVADIVGGEGQARWTFLESHLQFTVVGFVITQETTLVFSFGDGVVAVNGETSVIPSFDGNRPPYPMYLLGSYDIEQELLKFEVRAHVPTCDLTSILIGTDGVADFIDAAEAPLPVTGASLGPLSQFWEEARFVQNPDMIRRRLALANREHAEGSLVKRGLLPDDTTLILARRI